MAITPTTPTLKVNPLATIEAAIAAARAKKLASTAGTPTQILPTVDPVQKQLEKRQAQEAKAQAKIDRTAKREATKLARETKKVERAANKEFKLAVREATKADKAAAREAKKAARAEGKAPAAKATNRLARLLAKLSPTALEAFEAIGEVTSEDAKALSRVFHAVATAFVPADEEVVSDEEAPAVAAE